METGVLFGSPKYQVKRGLVEGLLDKQQLDENAQSTESTNTSDTRPASCNDEPISQHGGQAMSFTAITLEAALAIEPAKLSGVIDGIPVNPAKPPARDIKHDEREPEEMIPV